MDNQTLDQPDNQTAIPTPDIAATTPAKKQRGRPRSTTAETPKSKTSETPQQKIERLEAELQKAHEAAKLHDEKMALIIGKTKIAKARADANYRRQLAKELRSEITNKSDLATIAELLIEP